MTMRMTESSHGVEDVVWSNRRNPLMYEVGEVEPMSAEEAIQRAIALEDGYAAAEKIKSQFAGFDEAVMLELTDMPSTEEAVALMKKLDGLFNIKGLDIKDDQYPVIELKDQAYQSRSGRGLVTHIAFAPIVKSPDNVDMYSDYDYEDPPANAASQAIEKTEPAESKPSDEPEPSDELQTEEPPTELNHEEPTKPVEPTKSEEPTKRAEPKPAVSGGLRRVYVDFKRKHPIPSNTVETRLANIRDEFGLAENANDGRKCTEGTVDGISYVVFIETSELTKQTLNLWRRAGRIPPPNSDTKKAVEFNDACVQIGFASQAKNIQTKAVGRLVGKVLSGMGMTIENAKAFALTVDPYRKNPRQKDVWGRMVLLPFCAVAG